MDPLIERLDLVSRELERVKAVFPIDQILAKIHEEGWEARMSARAAVRRRKRLWADAEESLRVLEIRVDDGSGPFAVAWGPIGGKSWVWEAPPMSDNGWMMGEHYQTNGKIESDTVIGLAIQDLLQ